MAKSSGIRFIGVALCACAIILIGLRTASASSTLFADDFNRPDSIDVGNGWISVDQLQGKLSILGGRLTNTDPTGAVGAVYRNLSQQGAITVSADLSHESGGGGLPNRYQTMFLVKGDSAGNGYGIYFDRGDVNYPSYVDLFDNGVMVAEVASSFQFGPEIHAVITYNPDGSISGTVSQPGNSYDFSFPARVVVSAGTNVVIRAGEFNVTSGGTIMPWIDNVVVTGDAVTPPTIIDQLNDLIQKVQDLNLPHHGGSEYLALLSDTKHLVEQNKTRPAAELVESLLKKISQDARRGILTAQQADALSVLALAVENRLQTATPSVKDKDYQKASKSDSNKHEEDHDSSRA